MIKGLTFDYGGTLVHMRPDEVILQDILEDLGFKFEIEQVSKAQRSFRAWWDAEYSKLPRGKRWTEEIRVECDRVALEELGLIDGAGEIAVQVTRKWDAYSELRLFDDTEPTLKTLHDAGLKLGVLSQYLTSSSQLRVELEALGIGRYFSLVLTSEDAGYDKPDPRLFHKACELIGLGVEDLCHVGNDYEYDVVGARNAGIRAILLEGEGKGIRRDCLVIRGLQELPDVVSSL